MRRLAEVACTDCAIVAGTASVAEARASGAAWTIITDADGRPAGVLATAELTDAPAESPMAGVRAGRVFVLPAQLPIDYIRRTSQFASNAGRLLTVRGIVVYGESATRPTGVWAGPAFTDTLFGLTATRSFDPTLPGRIDIPPVQLECAFAEAAVVCGRARKFDELPDDMPPCDNPRHLTAHSFTW